MIRTLIFSQMKNFSRLLINLYHTVEMAISLFFYLGKAEWESEYDSNLKNMTLMEFARSDQVRSNWMTR